VKRVCRTQCDSTAVTTQAQAVDNQETFIFVRDFSNADVGAQVDGDTSLASNVAHGSVVHSLQLGLGCERCSGDCGYECNFLQAFHSHSPKLFFSCFYFYGGVDTAREEYCFSTKRNEMNCTFPNH